MCLCFRIICCQAGPPSLADYKRAAAKRPPSHATCPPCPAVPQDGNNSPLLEWEQEYLTDKGVLSNANLASVVQAVSYFE